MQAAKFTDPFHIVKVLQEIMDLGVVDAIQGGVHFLQREAALFQQHIIRVPITSLAQYASYSGDDLFGQFSAQFDIHAATGHVGGNGDRTKRSGSGDDLAFLGMLAGI